MSQSPFGRTLSERELEHRRRMLAHLSSPSPHRSVQVSVSRPPVTASRPPDDSPERGRIIPFTPRAAK